MGRISEEDIRRVRDATDLVALVSERVVLKQKGRLYWGCCPFHAEKTPSFKVDPSHPAVALLRVRTWAATPSAT